MEQLRLLSIFHYIAGALGALFSMFPVIHFIIGWMMVFSPESMGAGDGDVPAIMGWFFIIFAATFILMGLTLSACVIASGNRLARRKNYWFSFIVACLECMLIPFGTILGVFTIIVLNRESVRKMYGLRDE